MRAAIIGSRTINPEIKLEFTPSQIISGGAIGVDMKAKQYAIHNNIPLIEILPDYEKYGKIAPIIRNKEIVNNCDIVIAYWDGISKGTKMVIDYANKKGIKVIINKI